MIQLRVGDIVKTHTFGSRMQIIRFVGDEPREAVCRALDEWDCPIGDEITCFEFSLMLVLRHHVEDKEEV